MDATLKWNAYINEHYEHRQPSQHMNFYNCLIEVLYISFIDVHLFKKKIKQLLRLFSSQVYSLYQ